MILNDLGTAVLITAIIIYGIAMISLCVYALRLSKKIHDHEELQKSLRIRHLLDHHAQTPLLGVVTPQNTKDYDVA
jgi:hypothetical protein